MINRGHFVNNIALPKSLVIDDNLQSYIDASFNEILTNAMGVELFNSFKNNPTDERFRELVNGGDFKVYTTIVKWQGLKGFPNLIALHAFCKLIKDNQITVTSAGVVKAKIENSENLNEYFNLKFVEVWNIFCDEYLKLVWYLRMNKEVFIELDTLHNYSKITTYGV